MSFSERMGLRGAKPIQSSDMDAELRHSLWNVCRAYFLSDENSTFLSEARFYSYAKAIQILFHKKPIDEIGAFTKDFVAAQLDFCKSEKWFRVYDYVEFLSKREHPRRSNFLNSVNEILREEASAFRFVSGKIAPVIDEKEIEEIESAASHQDKFRPIAIHVAASLECFARAISSQSGS